MISFEKCVMCCASVNLYFRNQQVCGEACFSDLLGYQRTRQKQEAQEKIEKLNRQGSYRTREGQILKGVISQSLLFLAQGETKRGIALLELAITLNIQ